MAWQLWLACLFFSPSLSFEMSVGCESVFFSSFVGDGLRCLWGIHKRWPVLFFPSLSVYLFTWVVFLEEGDRVQGADSGKGAERAIVRRVRVRVGVNASLPALLSWGDECPGETCAGMGREATRSQQ